MRISPISQSGFAQDLDDVTKNFGFGVPLSLLRSTAVASTEPQQTFTVTIVHNHTSPTMSLAAFISAIWAGFNPAPQRRRTVYIDPDSIEFINHWFPGNRNKKQPRRLVETPTAGHWPEYRVAKSVVAKGRKRCGECGALVKEKVPATKKRVVKGSVKGKKGKKAVPTARVVRSLRGRAVEYAG
jgi:hypothetical protein